MALPFLVVLLISRAADAYEFTCGDEDCDTDDNVRCCNEDFTDCAQCCLDAHCQSPQLCNQDTQMCVDCLSNRNCKVPNPVCDANGICVAECTTNADCTEPNETCNVADGQCVCAKDMKPCNGARQNCVADGNCGCEDDYIRDVDGSCVRDCNPTCHSTRICARNSTCICRPGTIENANGGCDPCTAADKECQTNADCDIEGERCLNNMCVCPTGTKLFKGRCAGRGELGGPCLNGKCKIRRLRCNVSTNMCVCRGDCVPETVCLKKKESSSWSVGGKIKFW